jgi:hypothetical protein
MQAPGARSPTPDELRSWQRFVADNLEFRLGVAIGGVVTRAWSDGAADPLAVPSLDQWRNTTGLPWFGFWARELLRWGTLDPFVAFALAQGLSRTRSEAAERRQEFEAWLIEDLEAERMIDPQLFLEWQRSLPRARLDGAAHEPEPVRLTGTDGRKRRYAVVPVRQGDEISWLDPAGYELAVSDDGLGEFGVAAVRDDFELRVQQAGATVRRIFESIA